MLRNSDKVVYRKNLHIRDGHRFSKHRRKIISRNLPLCGFTLIELLVVIAIISLLVSILLPSLQKAKDLARSVACLAQLRGWNLSLGMYANDYANRLILHDSSNGSVGNPTWEYILADLEYTPNDPNHHRCPAQDKSSLPDYTTYVANAYMWGYNYLANTGTCVNGILDDVKTDPTTSIMMAELPHVYNDLSGSSRLACAWNHLQCITTSFGSLHNESMNFLFLDGHVEPSENTGDFYDPASRPEDYYLCLRYWSVGTPPR